MNIQTYSSDLRFSSCPNAFLVTGKPKDRHTDALNRKLISQNKTGYWKVASGRINEGDAVFILLPNQERADGYPRALFGGKVTSIAVDRGDRTVVAVEEFFELPAIERDVSVFLMGKTPPQGNTALQVWDSQTLNNQLESFEDQVRQSLRGDRQSRLARLEFAERVPSRTTKSVEVFARNPDVVAEALDLANGICGDCGNNGPFISRTDGRYFLEVHHIKRLADGGEDTVANTIALCPNCHRKRHYLL